jgi:hypothetical protein
MAKRLAEYEAIQVRHNGFNVTNSIRKRNQKALWTIAFNKKEAKELIENQIRRGFGFYVENERVGDEFYGKLDMIIVKKDNPNPSHGTQQTLLKEGK